MKEEPRGSREAAEQHRLPTAPPINGQDYGAALAVVTDEVALVEALRKRADQLNVSRTELDRVSGMAPGYCAKLLCLPPMRYFGPQSFWNVAGAMGLAVLLVEDPVATARFSAKMQPRNRRAVRHLAIVRSGKVPWLFTPEKAREMTARRIAKVPEWKRIAIAKKASRAASKARRAKARGAKS